MDGTGVCVCVSFPKQEQNSVKLLYASGSFCWWEIVECQVMQSVHRFRYALRARFHKLLDFFSASDYLDFFFLCFIFLSFLAFVNSPPECLFMLGISDSQNPRVIEKSLLLTHFNLFY